MSIIILIIIIKTADKHYAEIEKPLFLLPAHSVWVYSCESAIS
jgi:hypothetical protein